MPETRHCTKIPYGSAKEASQDLRSKSNKDSGLQPYHCPHCGYWHLTSKSKHRRRSQWSRIEEQPPPQGITIWLHGVQWASRRKGKRLGSQYVDLRGQAFRPPPDAWADRRCFD